MTIPKIQVNSTDLRTIGNTRIETTEIFVTDIPKWLTDQPTHSVPSAPPATVIIGNPVIDLPGCVEAHEQNDSKEKSGILAEDDPNGVKVFCDAGYPTYDAMNYEPDQLQMEIEAPPPPIVKPPEAPEVDTPEVPPIPPTEETPCPAPNQPRVGDLTQNGEERVIGHEVRDGQCVVLYEDTTAIQRFLPSTNQASVTAAIAVVATASAAATPLLLRVIKPVVKQLIKKVQKALGKEPPKLSANEMQTNKYREERGLPPFKRPKKRTQHTFGALRYFKKKNTYTD